jgi:glycosyltransferase involved in cell wall biosynthesis
VDPSFASCCLLSYERPDFLRTALTTLVAHAEYPLELIVHDDGSENEEVKIALRQLQDKGLISTLITNSPGHNEGVGVAVNRCFDVARGDYLLKLDQDLIFEPGWLRKAVNIMDTNAANEDQLEPRIGSLGLFRYGAEPVKYEDMFVRDWGVGETAWEEHLDFVGSAMVFRASDYKKYGPFPERSAAFAEDLEFKNLLKSNGLRMALPNWGDLARNVGFGYGPSTVVVKDENEQLTSRDIKQEPLLLGKG